MLHKYIISIMMTLVPTKTYIIIFNTRSVDSSHHFPVAMSEY